MNPSALKEVQEALLDELESTFGSLTMVDVGAVAEAVENALQYFLVDLICQQSRHLLQEAAPVAETPGSFTWKSETYRLAIGPAIDEEDLLKLAVLRHSPEAVREASTRKTVPIRGFWRYRRLRLFVPRALPVDRDFLLALVLETFATAHRWLLGQVDLAVGDKSVSCGRVFATLRTVIPDQSIASQIWLVSTRKRHGFFLLDGRTVLATLERVAGKAPKVDKSAFELVSNMMNMYLPFELMHTRVAISAGRCIDVDLVKESRYKQLDQGLLEAELAIYGGRSISIFPLQYDHEPFLAAGFPTRHRTYIEGLLKFHGSRLVEQHRRFSSRIRRLARELSRPSTPVDAAKAGEFVGGALVGALKRLAE